ncbi:unnamed protein product, partial [marine sediment metagenome]
RDGNDYFQEGKTPLLRSDVSSGVLAMILAYSHDTPIN